MKSKMTLFEQVKLVHNEKSFINFLDALRRDKIEKIMEWQNTEIEDYLDCAIEWANVSINGLKYYEKSDNPWKRAAEILYMGKIYE